MRISVESPLRIPAIRSESILKNLLFFQFRVLCTNGAERFKKTIDSAATSPSYDLRNFALTASQKMLWNVTHKVVCAGKGKCVLTVIEKFFMEALWWNEIVYEKCYNSGPVAPFSGLISCSQSYFCEEHNPCIRIAETVAFWFC